MDNSAKYPYLDKVSNWIFNLTWKKFYVILILILTIKTGVWFIPNLEIYRQISINPFANPFIGNENAQYLVWSWLGPFVAWILKVNSFTSFLVLHALFLVGFYVSTLRLIHKALPEREARISATVFITLPFSSTGLYWIGMDALTLLLLVQILVFRKNWFLSIIFAVLLGMQHFEQGILAVGILAMFEFTNRRVSEVRYSRTLMFHLRLILGLGIGKTLLGFIFNLNGMNLNSGRLYLYLNSFAGLAELFVNNFQIIVWSSLGVGWLLLFAIYNASPTRSRNLLFAGILSALSAALVFDQTRVAAIVSFLFLATGLLLEESLIKKISNRFLVFYLGLWTIVPFTWVFGGIVKTSVITFDVAWAIRLAGMLFSSDIPANTPPF
jgi:hypothetical protein